MTFLVAAAGAPAYQSEQAGACLGPVLSHVRVKQGASGKRLSLPSLPRCPLLMFINAGAKNSRLADVHLCGDVSMLTDFS